ncbi:hypothetical protein IDJ77_24905 [Mucilaginibacter sp. ZT4R22]|uniref:Uncharacterized protein n=1 Tax=Mucilaginibacter pankratovii TaxID=2772110 RepID=A0ABR7WXS0_9SPHI|nr:hypothetical protein [Mucilaginibacter pankratovii]MBD1367074.1 hypothetical protein [Mucilaginibacter pankratovii]
MGKVGMLWLLISAMWLYSGCAHNKKLYTSDCSAGIAFKKVSYTNLVDSIKYYDKQYVEVYGKYTEGKNLSALVNDSLFADHGNSRALWVNFTQDCPLYLKGTQQGFFASEDGSYAHMNNRMVTIRGQVDVLLKGHQKAYSGTINQVSYIELY